MTFHTEEQLRAKMSHQGELVDFLVEDHRSKMLIEAKGVELVRMGRVIHNKRVFSDKMRSSIIKGISQALSTARALADRDRKQGSKLKEDQFLLVVTFKDFFVVNGLDLYNFIDKQPVDEIVARHGGNMLIPLENMYFLSVDDFDFFAQSIREGKVSLVEGLKKAVNMDSARGSPRFAFRQHVGEDFHPQDFPQFLEDEMNDMAENLLRHFESKTDESARNR